MIHDLFPADQELTTFDAQRKPQILIAGPCSAETEAQVLATAEALSKIGIDYFRAGVWKPRTSPGSFEGNGNIALQWLQKAKELYGIKVAVEVATPKHIEEALAHQVDLLWIGARTTVNPFAVQEIADALKGINVPVMVKNPMNPDLGLWIGAIKRLQKAGITEIMACHRGFNVYHTSVLRNPPLWEIPLEFKRRMPEIPLICDPSHICGNRLDLANIAQRAMDLGFEGLILETHPTPDEAWSDAAQQITPNRFLELISQLRYRKTSSQNLLYNTYLQQLRVEIDEIDEQLLGLLADRLKLAKKIGEIKNQNGVAFFQHDRWSEVLQHIQQLAQQLGINPDFAQKLFELMHLESLEIQGE
ncbi:MAG: chorismate mutase [Bacteroidia bacterium]